MSYPLSIKILVGVITFLGIKKLLDGVLALDEWTFRQLLAGLTGAIFGLFFANLLVLPPALFISYTEIHSVIASLISLIFMFVFGSIFIKYEPKILQTAVVKSAAKNTNMIKILDTNTLIDSRIGKLVQIHFVEGLLIIPDFVMDELKKIADNNHDELKKQRGRHALKIVRQMIDEYDHIVLYTTGPSDNVDKSIIELAQNLNGKIISSDQNLLELAATKKVATMSINELCVALQMAHLHGEKLSVKVIREGNENGQGLAYTEDGTMIVVTDGADHIGENVDVIITRHIQSKYGIVIFADIL